MVGIDRPQEAAGKARGELTHGEDLHAIFARARSINPCHVSGELGVHYDGTAQFRHSPYPRRRRIRQSITHSGLTLVAWVVSRFSARVGLVTFRQTFVLTLLPRWSRISRGLFSPEFGYGALVCDRYG
jgi:hypothetical protein